jgi:hypothetical protein
MDAEILLYCRQGATDALQNSSFARADASRSIDDLPWKEVQAGLAEIGFAGWTTAEVGGGGLDRLTTVRQQMHQALGVA